MVVRLGYKNKFVEVRNGVVYLFDGKFWSVLFERVVEYYWEGQGVILGLIWEIVSDFYCVFFGENFVREMLINLGGWYGEMIVS